MERQWMTGVRRSHLSNDAAYALALQLQHAPD